ncbi:hypothetical protein CVT24_008842 [Panaeolus cyanescens]|uniref:Uncharacterized protein n=1 Tax=Panaeolus cyanescens TaxID=181874 RepID=A0A409XAF5_9AGAR|nr:hypothetical protein CVT24_008842 [Panaeolus cyanescens]
MIMNGIYDDAVQSFVFDDECEGLDEEEVLEYYQYPDEGRGSGNEAYSDSESAEHESDVLPDVDPGDYDHDDEYVLHGEHADEDDKYEEDQEELGEQEIDNGAPMEVDINIQQDVDSNIRHEPIYVVVPLGVGVVE